MSSRKTEQAEFGSKLRKLLLFILVLFLVALFLIWRIDSPRMEAFRARLVDKFVPSLTWVTAPTTGLTNILRDFQSYGRIHQQNQELRRELQQMKAWKEAALQLEQENARLRDLNNVRLDPKFTYVTGVVLADSGSPFRQSVLLNIGERDGIRDGWAAIDGLGLVGRVSGVGGQTARVLLLTDPSSRVPVTIQPSGRRALVIGDNTTAPTIEFLESQDQIRPGDRIVTSGDGGVFPPGLLMGQVAEDPRGRMRVRLAADYERLEYLRILRDHGREKVEGTGDLIGPLLPEVPEIASPDTSEADKPASPAETGGNG